MMSKPVIVAYLDLEIFNGNTGRTKHFRSAKKLKDFYSALLKTWPVTKRKPFPYRVRLVITRILGQGQQLWDADSVGRGSVKELLDALVDRGWFTDDGPKYIRPVDFRQDENRRDEGPAVEIHVYRNPIDPTGKS